MTARIYYLDSRARRFDAVVAWCRGEGGRFDVSLDRTAFYPTSGGQPFDTGRIGGVPVIDVVDRDDEVVHVVAGPLEPGTLVTGEIDWPRRRDHMEQHTGQHILSAAFDAACGASTVGFHMGAEVSTIDLAREVTAEEIARAEIEANRVIRDDRDVVVRIVPESEAGALALRRASTRTGDLRVVEVTGFDLSACGGTHVSRTGEIGLVAATAWERVRGGTRVSFVCGGRALAAVQRLRDAVNESARLLGTAPVEVAAHLARLHAQARDAERLLTVYRDEVATARGTALRARAETIGSLRVVLAATDETDPGMLKKTAQGAAVDDLAIVLIGRGEPVPVVAARGGTAAFDAGAFIKVATAALGGRGGGRPDLAQGGVTATSDALLAFARTRLGEG